MWSRHDAVAVQRQVLGLVGLPPAEFTLHSLQIGGLTHLSAVGQSGELLQKEGRWKSGAYKSYASCGI